MTKEQYIRNQVILQRRLEKQFAPAVYAALHSQIAEAVAAIKEKGLQAAQGNIHGSVINTELGPVIDDLYATAAKQAIKKYKPNKKAFGYNEEFIAGVIAYLKQFILNKVVLPISQTTIDWIERVMQQGIDEGWGVDRVVKELEDSDVPKWRARLIVRTESVRATNFTQMSAADEEDIEMEKQWIAVDDSRTRRTHRHTTGVDGQRRDLDQKFSNGLMFPGDPEGGASEVCNCRCTMGYFAKRDEKGRLIPKAPQQLNLISRMNIGRQAA